MDRDHARFIQQCVDKLSTLNHTLIKGDAFRFMKSCKKQFDFIFADPPYALPKLEAIPDLALPLLKEGGIMVFEHGKQNDFSQHPRYVEHRSYGSVNFTIFR
jgi:16S rRNA G966 N2-methylase RsmD